MSVNLLENLKLEYRGRMPKRVDGQSRREKIIKAAEQIIVESGIQGVKHRAVAELADVPLAATTYYFEDLAALLHDVFVDFTYRNLKQVASLEESALSQISMGGSVEPDSAAVAVVFENIADLIFDHILRQVSDRHDRLIERAFANEALRNKDIAAIVNAIEIKQLESISDIFTVLGSDNAISDARELLATILFLEHRLLTGVVSEKEARLTIGRAVRKLVSG